MTELTEPRPWSVAVVGCGAMGSIYAGLLAAAGNVVTVVDPWQAHVDAINRDGLRVVGTRGDQVTRVTAVTAPEPGDVNLVIIASKSLAVRAAAQSAQPLIGPNTLVLTIQNGLGSSEVVADVVGEARLLVGIAGGFGASLVAPGHAHHNAMQIVRIGPYAGAGADVTADVVDLWQRAGFKAEATSDVKKIQWEKLICNVGFSGPCVLINGTVGEVMDDPDISEISRKAATEAFEVAVALGVSLDVTDPVEHARAFGASVRSAKPSTLLDHERSRKSEIDVINGAVAREAARIGRDAPVNATITAFVKRLERSFAG